MSQVVSSQIYCLENSVHLTRPGSDAFYQSDKSHGPIIIDKHQTKRLYHLQRTPYLNTCLHLDKSNDEQRNFENILNKQLNESSIQPIAAIYHRPNDMSDASMAKFSLGKSRPDPQRLVPSQMTSVRNHPAAITILRHEQGPNSEIVPRFTDRSVSDRIIRGRMGFGGSLNLNEDTKLARDYLQNRGRLPTQTNFRKQKQSTINDLARHYMYTSVQQASFDEVAWDSKLPSKIPVPLTTYEADGSDPLLTSRSLPSFQDSRSYDVLEWDRLQSRNDHFIRKTFTNVAPLTRAQQISGYSGVIGGDNIQDIDNPNIDFKPYTIVRNEQPKLSIDSSKSNMPSYTGKTHWTKIDPISHHDQFGHAYTTSAAFHKSLPFDKTSPRHTNLHGQLSRSVTTVIPQNPFNQIDNTISTVNGSLDSRPHVLLRHLPRTTFPPSPRQTEEIPPE